MEISLFSEISLIIAIGTFIGLVMHLLRQPLIMGHIITGVLVGPSVFNLVRGEDTVNIFAQFGVALLLFIIGLGLNPRVIKEVGKVSAYTGIGQVLFTSLIGFGIVKALGYSNIESLYIAVALSFSSTIIILKLLSDRKEQNRLYGKISIGFLLVQDIIATFALLFAASFGAGADSDLGLIDLLMRGVFLGSFFYLLGAYLLPRAHQVIASSQEFLFLFSIGWGLGIASLTAELGFSLEVGALFAGVTLASMPYAQEIGTRLRPLRDFFIVLFFISLGSELGLSNILGNLPHALLLALFVLVGNPLIVIMIMGVLGYTKKTSFKAGLAVAQISEFSLVLILLGRDLGNISEDIVSLITLVALITIAASTYMILYSDELYKLTEKYLKLFERRKVRYDQESAAQYSIVLFGYKKGGAEFIRTFKQMNKPFVVIDYDPEVIDHLDHRGMNYIYGDALDLELLEEAGVNHAKLVVSTITDHNTNKILLEQVVKLNKRAVLICQSDTPKDAAELYQLGATYVMMPHYIGSEQIGNFIKKKGLSKVEFNKFRQKHIADLESHYELYS
ncbi:MAG TPA: cation:proton antiporter [Candidatus Saccharimonadales bacterium]